MCENNLTDYSCPNGLPDLFSRHNYSDLIIYARFAPPINCILNKVSYPFWCAFGYPGSILSIYIWSRRHMRHCGNVAASVYQTALGVIDLAFFTVQLAWYLHTAWHLRSLDWPVVCESFAVANYLLQYASPMLTLVFTTERFFSICFPFKSGIRRFGTSVRSALFIVLCTILICALFASIQGFFYTVTNGQCGLRPKFELEGEKEWRFYTTWTTFTELLIFGLIPLICLLLNLAVIRTFHRLAICNQKISVGGQLHRKTGRASLSQLSRSNLFLQSHADVWNDYQQSRQSSTISLLCVSFYLIFAHFSVALMVLLYILLPMGDVCLSDEQIVRDAIWQNHFRFFTARSFVFSFGMSHYAAKFYIYLATSAAFREQCILTLCQWSDRYRHEPWFHDASPDQIFSGSTLFPQNVSRRISTSSQLGDFQISAKYSTLSNNGNLRISRKCSVCILFANKDLRMDNSAHLPVVNSRLSLSAMANRLSTCSIESKSLLNARKLSSVSRQRPQAGISKTVLNEAGQRVHIK